MARLQTPRRSSVQSLWVTFAVWFLVILIGAVIGYWWRVKEPVYQGKSVTEWVDQLSTNQSGGRLQAEEALQTLGHRAVPVLERNLKNGDGAAIGIYTKVSPLLPEKLRTATRKMLKPHDRVMKQIRAAQALGIIGTNAKEAVPELGEIMRGQNVAVAGSAATALGEVGQAALPELIRALDSREAMTRSHACLALRMMGEKAGPACDRLGVMLDSNYLPDVTLASSTLGAIGSPAIPILVKSLASTNKLTLLWTANAIAQMNRNAEAAVPGLLRHVDDPDPRVRMSVIRALAAAIFRSPEVDAVILAALEDPQLDVRRTALEVLGPGYRPSAIRCGIPQLIKLLSDPDAEIRAHAAIVIGSIGKHAAPAVPQLQAALQDSHPKVRQEVENALAQIPRQ